MPLRALFVDFNSYFASVEQQLHPHLRGRPVAVVPMLAENTSCIAASYEAKYFGVKTGTRVCEARRLCPGLQLVESHPQIYVEFHHRLIAAVDACVPVREVLSIDEMTCDLTGSMMRRERNVQIARDIKATIARDVGAYLRCSIGIAPNTFLAKTATELEKPDGLVVIETGDLPDCLFGLQLRELCGIGARIERRLYLHGIVTVQQLCGASVGRLRNVWGGIEGERMYQNLRGEVVARPPTQRASLSHSHILPPHARNARIARATLCRLLQKAATRLRKMNYVAGEISIYLKFLDRETWSEKTRFSPTSETALLTRHMLRVWRNRPREYSSRREIAPLGVGVVLGRLKLSNQYSLSLFDPLDPGQIIDRAMDEINDHFGPMTVYLGGAHHALSSSDPPIAFNNIPELITKVPLRRHAEKPESAHDEFARYDLASEFQQEF